MKTAPAETFLARFLDTMASVPSPVAVVTTYDAGAAHGTTVSAFCSLSARPPMILVSLDNGSRLLGHIRNSGRFGLNLLADDQSQLARRFASKADDKFNGIEHDLVAGVPLMSGTAGWVTCQFHAEVPGGDHTILLGAVTDAASADRAPLTYHARSFGTNVPLVTREAA
jgi:flavin reductase (DIM6/NTAB) family NADH-FMN oxidoreductase RutF